MAVQVWIGEKPEHPNERKAIIALANGLERLEGLYVMLANFSVGGHTIDLVIIKHDAIFIIEMKHCDGKVYGSVNGRWKAVSGGGSVKWLNQGRKNPYNQVIAYYYAFRNFLHDRRLEFLSEQKANWIDFRACKRLVVIAPTLERGSEIELDWKVIVKGLDELPTFLVTERTDEINLSDNEILAIPSLLHCSPWNEVNHLVAGVMPDWQGTPSEPPQIEVPAPVVVEPEPEPVVQPEPVSRFPRRRLRRMAAALTALLISVMAVFAIFSNPPSPPVPPADATATAISSNPLLPSAGTPPRKGCVDTVTAQRVRKQRNEDFHWYTVAQYKPGQPAVTVELERVEFCADSIVLYWSLQNGTAGIVQMGLNNANIKVRDNVMNQYQLREERVVIRVRQNMRGYGSVELATPATPNATTLQIELVGEPFGPQLFTVPIPAPSLISDR